MPSAGSKIRNGCLTPAFLGAQKRAKLLRNPCIVGGRQLQARKAKSEVAVSTWPSRGAKGGQICYVTPAFSTVPNAKRGEQNQKCLPHPYLLADPKEGRIATSRLHSRGSAPTDRSKIRSGWPTSAFLWAGKRRKCYVTPAFSKVPNANHGDQHHNWLPSWVPGRGQKWHVTRAVSGVPNAKCEGQNHKWLPQPCLLGAPKEVRKCHITTAFPWVPNAKGAVQNQKWLPHCCLLGGPKEGINATSHLHSRGSPTQSAGNKVRSGSPLHSRGPKRGQNCYVSGVHNAKRAVQNQKWLPHPCLLGGPKEGGNGNSPPVFSGVPNAKFGGGKIKRGYLTLACSGAEKKAEMLCHPCILRGPQRQARGAKSEVAASTLPFGRPKRGRKCYATLHSRGSPTPSAGTKITSGCLTPACSRAQKKAEMLHQPCILGGPQHQARGAKPELASSPLPSRGPKRGQKCYVTLHPRRSATPSTRSQITSGCLTPAFWEAQKRAEMLHHPCNLGVPNAKGGKQHQEWLPHPCLVRDPKGGGNAM